MKKTVLTIFLALGQAFSLNAQTDSTFCRTLYNMEENIYIVMDFDKQNITIPNQEFMGEMAGYIGDYKDYRKWLILGAKVVNSKKAKLSISNDEGSEDLEAELCYNADGTYTLKQGNGSTLKIARNRKWHKLPKTLIFTKTK